MSPVSPSLHSRATEALYGLALGDALGMPTQMLSRPQITARYGPVLTGFHRPGHPGPGQQARAFMAALAQGVAPAAAARRANGAAAMAVTTPGPATAPDAHALDEFLRQSRPASVPRGWASY
jgi:hypothetical protein